MRGMLHEILPFDETQAAEAARLSNVSGRRRKLRVDAMIAAGWIDEVSRLIQQGGSPSLHCFKAIGYREISAYLRGETAQEEMIDRIKARTRQFAKLQMTWLRKEPDAHWIQYEGDDLASALVEIEKLLE